MADICGYCGIAALYLPRCAGCHQVYYCSTECQRADWKGQHKVKCKEIQSRDRNKNLNSQSKHHLSKKRTDKRTRTLFPNNEEDTRGEDNKTRQSQKRKACGKTTPVSEHCSRGNVANCCSTKCQKQNCKEHELNCSLPEEADYETITTDGFRREEAFASGSRRRADLLQARRLALKTFVGSMVLYSVREISHSTPWVRQKYASEVFVECISRYHEHLDRCIYLQDEDGDEVLVRFDMKYDGKRSHFRLSDVVPGRYLCVKDPLIDYLSGTICVDNAQSVRLFCI